MLISRKEAKTQGLKRYFTGVPCVRGHVAEKYASNGWCVECAAAGTTAWVAMNRKLINSRAHERRIADPELHRRANREYAARSRTNNRPRHNAWNARSRARRKTQTCTCCTQEQFEQFYALAREWSMEVDHRRALGLGGRHCTQNLQLLTHEWHAEKTAVDRRLIRELKKAA